MPTTPQEIEVLNQEIWKILSEEKPKSIEEASKLIHDNMDVPGDYDLDRVVDMFFKKKKSTKVNESISAGKEDLRALEFLRGQRPVDEDEAERMLSVLRGIDTGRIAKVYFDVKAASDVLEFLESHAVTRDQAVTAVLRRFDLPVGFDVEGTVESFYREGRGAIRGITDRILSREGAGQPETVLEKQWVLFNRRVHG